MKENTDSKRKISPSIPANYISILQLQERWINEKERKQREVEEERERQAEKQQRIEEDRKKPEVKGKREDLDENRSGQKHLGRNSKKTESIDGGEARCAEKEETVTISSERGENADPRDDGLPEKKKGVKKRYKSKKKRKNQEVAAVKEDVVDECGSIAPPEYVVTENNTPVKVAIRVYRKKGEKATGKESAEKTDATAIETRSSNLNRRNQRRDLHPQRVAEEEDVVDCGTENHTPVKEGVLVYRKGKISVGSREKAVSDDATAIETQFEHLSIKRGEERRETKAQTRSPNRSNQKHDLPPRRVRMPIETATMVWVKKGQNVGADDGNGSGVKPLNA